MGQSGKGSGDRWAAQVAQVSASEMAKSKEFARYIRDKYPNIRITLRWVLLKDMTDTDSELEALADFAKDLRDVFHTVELIPYHELGREKYDALKMSYPLGDDMPPYKVDDAKIVKERLESAGVRTILSAVEKILKRIHREESTLP